MFDWNDLKYLLAVARHQSTTAAGRALQVNQSTVQRRLAELERGLGQALVVRHPTGYQLTGFGEQLLPLAQDVERAALALARHVEAFQRDVSGVVRVTCPEPLMLRLSSSTLLERFRARYPALQGMYAAFAKLAESSVTLLTDAEIGTGKELLAESIHQPGPRRDRPFVVFDPTRVTEADEQMALFERADGGSLLIDGPADMTLELQRKLMRTIERGELQRVGSDRVTKVDVRLITTSLADVDRAVEDGRLREDLVHRLFAVRLSIPPLRRRREDIPPLFEHFWRTLGGGDAPVPASLVTRYESYAWPGNVRELQNVVAREIVLGDTSADTDEALAPAPEVDVDLPFPQARQLAIARFEEAYVTRLLERHGGNISRAAAASGVAHRYFQILKARHKR